MRTHNGLRVVDQTAFAQFAKAISQVIGTAAKREIFINEFKSDPLRAFSDLFMEANEADIIPFFRLIDEPELFKKIIETENDEEFADSLIFLKEAWETISTVTPEEAAELRTRFDTNPYFRLDDVFRRNLNDILEAYGRISIDGIPSLRYQGVIRLGHANKQLGRNDEIFVSSSLRNFFTTIAIMLTSARLTDDETKELVSAADPKIKSDLVDIFDDLSRVLSEVREDYLGKKSTDS